MVAKTTAKRKKWFVDLCEKGCQICGIKFPNLKNNGLQWSHIVSTTVGGRDTKDNCLALCPNCETSFDIVVKPAIYRALMELAGGKVPENWKEGEGRRSGSANER